MKMPKSSFIVEDKPKSYITIYIAILLHCSTLKKKNHRRARFKITLLQEYTPLPMLLFPNKGEVTSTETEISIYQEETEERKTVSKSKCKY